VLEIDDIKYGVGEAGVQMAMVLRNRLSVARRTCDHEMIDSSPVGPSTRKPSSFSRKVNIS
jgi:hypothetical protein